MRRPSIYLLVFVFLPWSLAQSAEVAGTEPERGFWPSLKRTWGATVDGVEFVTGKTVGAAKATGSAVKSATGTVVNALDPFSKKDVKAAPKLPLRLEVDCSPLPVILKQTSSLKVVVTVVSEAKRAQLLEFTSAERASAVLRDGSGKIVCGAASAGSESRQHGVVTINPGERLEYVLQLPTAGLVAGRTYTLEASLVGQTGLVARSQISVQ